MNTQIKKLEGKEAVKFENFMHTGDLDVSANLHEDIEPEIPESRFVIWIHEEDDGVWYEYGNLENNLNFEHNWSQLEKIVGMDTLEDVKQALEEVSVVS